MRNSKMDRKPETFDDAVARLRERAQAGEFTNDEAGFDLEFARIEALAAGEVAALDAEIAERREFLRRRVSQQAAQECLTAAGIAPKFLKVATKLFLQSYRLEFRPDDDGEPGAVAITDEGPVTVAHVAS